MTVEYIHLNLKEAHVSILLISKELYVCDGLSERCPARAHVFLNAWSTAGGGVWGGGGASRGGTSLRVDLKAYRCSSCPVHPFRFLLSTEDEIPQHPLLSPRLLFASIPLPWWTRIPLEL